MKVLVVCAAPVSARATANMVLPCPLTDARSACTGSAMFADCEESTACRGVIFCASKRGIGVPQLFGVRRSAGQWSPVEDGPAWYMRSVLDSGVPAHPKGGSNRGRIPRPSAVGNPLRTGWPAGYCLLARRARAADHLRLWRIRVLPVVVSTCVQVSQCIGARRRPQCGRWAIGGGGAGVRCERVPVCPCCCGSRWPLWGDNLPMVAGRLGGLRRGHRVACSVFAGTTRRGKRKEITSGALWRP